VATAALALVAAVGGGALEARDAQAPGHDIGWRTTVARALGVATLKSSEGSDYELTQFTPRTAALDPARAKWRFLVQGGVHGNEQASSDLVQWMARRYARGDSLLNKLPQGEVAIDFLPYANPDGYKQRTRVNARGVNLNRNFGVLWGLSRENPGKESFSEPETQAIRSLFAARHYTAAVDVHGYINWIVAPSSPVDVTSRGTRPTLEQARTYRQWTGSLRREMALLPGYELKTGARLGDGGAFEDWAFWERGTLAFCLEMETFQRFVRAYRRDFADVTKTVEAPAVDLFKRYEAFVYRMFAAAIEIRSAKPVKDELAGG
jgi:hypothetical protein